MGFSLKRPPTRVLQSKFRKGKRKTEKDALGIASLGACMGSFEEWLIKAQRAEEKKNDDRR